MSEPHWYKRRNQRLQAQSTSGASAYPSKSEILFRIFLFAAVALAFGLPWIYRDTTPPAIYGPIAKTYHAEIIASTSAGATSAQRIECRQSNKHKLRVWCAASGTDAESVAQHFVFSGWQRLDSSDSRLIVLEHRGKTARITPENQVVHISIEEQ